MSLLPDGAAEGVHGLALLAAASSAGAESEVSTVLPQSRPTGRPRLQPGLLQRSWRYFAVDLPLAQAVELVREWLRRYGSDPYLGIRHVGWRACLADAHITFLFHCCPGNKAKLSERSIQRKAPICADRTWQGMDPVGKTRFWCSPEETSCACRLTELLDELGADQGACALRSATGPARSITLPWGLLN